MFTSSLKVVYLVVVAVQLANQEKTYYVLPDHEESSGSKSGDGYVCGNSNCSTHTDLVQGISEQIQDDRANCLLDTTIALLPGVHTIRRDSGMLLKINCSENLVFRAFDLQAGATIHCSCSLTGFQFDHAVNLSILGLTFENCGSTFQHLWHVSILIEHAIGIDIKDVVIKGSQEVGLYIRNPHGTVNIFKLHLEDNPSHFHFQMDEDHHVHSNLTDEKTYLIMESCSIIQGGKNFGLKIYIKEKNHKIVMQLRNISVHHNSNCTIDILLNEMCFGNITLENLTVYESRYSTIVLNTASTRCEPYPASVGIYHAAFKNCGFSIGTTASVDTSKPVANHTVTIAETLVQGSRERMALSSAGNIVIRDVTIENCQGSNEYLEKDFDLCLIVPKLYIQGTFTFRDNKGGVSIFSCKTSSNEGGEVELDMGGTVLIENNMVRPILYTYRGSAMSVKGSRITLLGGSSLKLIGNSGLKSGGLLLQNTSITFRGEEKEIHCIFSHNRGSVGGAVAFYDRSCMRFHGNRTRIYFTSNYATEYGGAMYVDDATYIRLQNSFSEYAIYYLNKFIKRIGLTSLKYPAPLFFTNNTAEMAGNTLFGGWLEKRLLPLVNTKYDLSNIASGPTRVCPCDNSIPNCNLTSIVVKRYPGQRYELEAVAVGQKRGTVPSVVQALVTRANSELAVGELETTEYTQLTRKSCTKLVYTLKSMPELFQNVTLRTVDYDSQKLETLKRIFNFDDEIEVQILTTQFNISFYLEYCPFGFSLDEKLKECVCQQALLDQGIQCDFISYNVLRPSPKWVNITLDHSNNVNISGPGVLIYNHCPHDFCKTFPDPLPLSLHHPDAQCNYNRSGILCGSCQASLSLTLGTSVCRRCSNSWMAGLIIPLIALAGLLLVAALIFLNLTVSVGTINGLIFYANIVRANNTFFFPNEASRSFLSVFIAWMNLDLGIEICLYNGMDAYTKTWLQFLFPAYIWIMVIMIIIGSHYSTKISRLSGNNAVQVLATLFLLSYAKLLRVIIIIFSSAVLVYPDDYRRRVWLYDGNVNYLQGKHITLFIVGLLLVLFISIPYTTILVTIQWLQKFSSWKIFMWVGKLHPLFDAYTGPFKIRHRYWTGLLLLVRVFLFLVFSLNTSNDPSINQLTIAVAFLCLLAYLAQIGGVYKQWPLTLLEIVFVSNLGILSAASGIYQEDSDRLIVTQTSTGAAFILFGAIIIYHFITRVVQSRKGRALKNYIIEKKEMKKKTRGEENVTPALSDSAESLNVSHSVVDLQELLLK